MKRIIARTRSTTGFTLSKRGRSEPNCWRSYEFSFVPSLSRLTAGDSALAVNYAITGSASNGVDYIQISGSITIPAHSNSVQYAIVPIQDALPENPETISITLLPDLLYGFGSTTNALITLTDYESAPPPPIPPLYIPTGTNQIGQVLSLQASTNMIDWTQVGIVTNTSGIIGFTETNSHLFKSRFFRAVPMASP